MRKAFLRQLRLAVTILLGYLLQVSVMPHLQFGGATPSLLIVVTAVVTVGYGKLRALWVGMIYGIIMETMLPTVTMLNLLFYPVSALLCSMFFADKSESRLQVERSTGRRGRNISPYPRTVGCAAMNVTVYEIVNLIYMYLSGATISSAILSRSLADIIATTALTLLLMIPLRKMMGFRKAEEAPTASLRFDHRPARD